MFTDRTMSHYILQANGTSENYIEAVTFKANVQPAGGESTAMINGTYGQVYTAFTTYSGLQIGDYVTASGTTSISGTSYRVKAVRNFNYGPLPHFEVTITLPEV